MLFDVNATLIFNKIAINLDHHLKPSPESRENVCEKIFRHHIPLLLPDAIRLATLLKGLRKALILTKPQTLEVFVLNLFLLFSS